MSEQRSLGFCNNFGALRILLAVMVVFSNSFLLGAGVTDGDPLKRFNHFQAISGHVAVDLFFIMSGYLIAGSLLRAHSMPEFFLDRARRVYPGFVLAAIFSSFAVLPVAGGHITAPTTLGDLGDFLYRTLRLGEPSYAAAFLHNPFPGEVNLSVWSISYGVWCYVLAAIFAAYGLLRAPRVLGTLLVLAAITGVCFQVWSYFPVPRFALAVFGYPAMWARVLPMFLAGLLLRSLRDRLPMDARLAAIALTALAVAAQIPHAWSGIFPFAGSYLLYYAAYTPKLRLWNAAALGDPSYGMYLWSFPIQQLLMQSFGHAVNPYLLFAASLPLSLAAGYFSWHAVERWCLPSGRETGVRLWTRQREGLARVG